MSEINSNFIYPISDKKTQFYLPTLLPVSQHFVSPGHSLDDFSRSKMYIINHYPSWNENQRQKRESFWICELQTLHPKGI